VFTGIADIDHAYVVGGLTDAPGWPGFQTYRCQPLVASSPSDHDNEVVRRPISQIAPGDGTSIDDGQPYPIYGSITVEWHHPPTLTVPSAITAEATSGSGAAVAFTASAVDQDGSAVAVACTPGSGSVFPLGTTTVSCSATDAYGSTATASFTITVRDTTPPTLSISLSPTTIWPPDGRLAPVTVSRTVHDLVDLAPVVSCSASASEPVSTGDIVEADGNFLLRAARSSTGSGRTYTITCSARDASGNVSPPAVATASVPHDMR